MNRFSIGAFLFVTTALAITTPVQGAEPENSSEVTRELAELKRQMKEMNQKMRVLQSRLNARVNTKVNTRDAKDNSQQKMRVLETRLNTSDARNHSQDTPCHWPKYYIPVPNTNSAIQFIVNPNLAVSYDASSYTSDFVYPPLLPLEHVSSDLKKSRFNAQAKATQFGFRTLSHTNIGDVKTEVSLDFWGDASNVIPSTPGYQPRLRFAYVEVAGFTVGQTTSNFLDLDAIGETVDYGSALGLSFRHGLIKYAFPLNKQTTLGVAIERPATDYTDQLGQTINYPAPPLSASAPSLPDLTANLKYEDKFGHVSLRGVARQLKVKDNTVAPQFIGKKNGWGLGVSGKFFVYHQSNLFAQFNFGDGIGRYIPMLNGQSSLYNQRSRVLDSQIGTNTIVGFEHFWSELFRSNIIYAHTHVKVSRFTPVLTGPTRVTKSLNQFYLNLIYSPTPPLDVGIEYEYADRKSVDNYQGKANCFTLGITYKF